MIKQDQEDTLEMLKQTFGTDVFFNGTTNRYLSDHIEELIAKRLEEALLHEGKHNA